MFLDFFFKKQNNLRKKNNKKKKKCPQIIEKSKSGTSKEHSS